VREAAKKVYTKTTKVKEIRTSEQKKREKDQQEQRGGS
jgi:hypothetical protein